MDVMEPMGGATQPNCTGTFAVPQVDGVFAREHKRFSRSVLSSIRHLRAIKKSPMSQFRTMDLLMHKDSSQLQDCSDNTGKEGKLQEYVTRGRRRLVIRLDEWQLYFTGALEGQCACVHFWGARLSSA